MNRERARFLIIDRINVVLVLTIVVAAIITASPVAFSKIAYAQATIVNLNPLETFSAKGLIGSLIFNTEGITEAPQSNSSSSDINITTNASITNAALTNKN